MGSMTGRTLDFGMRPEQQTAVDKTAAYLQSDFPQAELDALELQDAFR